jgi:uncharacterized repeat protein (TIGR03803 family)
MELQQEVRLRRRPSIESLESRTMLSATLTTLASFVETNGQYPVAGVIVDSVGDVFGTTSGVGNALVPPNGPTNNLGTVFEIPAGSGEVDTLVTFNGTNGQYPDDPLTLDSSGDLFGTTSDGGSTSPPVEGSSNGQGIVFEIPSGGAIQTLNAFAGGTFGTNPGANPEAGVIIDSSGNLYGTTTTTDPGEPGEESYGLVYEIPAGGGSEKSLATFSGSDGDDPAGNLVEFDGNLYGTTAFGGAPITLSSDGDGTIYEVPTSGGTPDVLAVFNGTNGSNPNGIIADSEGNLYGTTTNGGADGYGTVFELPAGSSTIKTLANFTGASGIYPSGGLIMDAAGDLFGLAENGAYGDGEVFELPAGSNTIQSVFSFNGTDGYEPMGSLVADANGNLYGTTETGGSLYQNQSVNSGGSVGYGTVFELSNAGFVTGKSITLTGPSSQSATAGTSQAFALGSFTDVGASAPFQDTINWGDGTANTAILSGPGAIPATAHDYTDLRNLYRHTNHLRRRWNSEQSPNLQSER